MPRNFFVPLRRYLTGFQAESFFTHSTNTLLLLLLVAATVVPATAQSTHHKKSNSKPKIQGGTSRQARPFNRHAIDALEKKGGEAPRAETGGPEQEQYDNRALPNVAIASAQQQNAYLAFQSVAKLPGGKKTNWQELGPFTPVVPGPSNYTGRTTTDSGRVTALAVSPICVVGNCKIFTGAAGGGVWEADNALDPQPNWHSSSSGLTSNAIGSLIFDPTDSLGKTLYAGTGEPNGSGDSEAGVGLFKSVDFGKTWTLVSGSVAAAKDRSIGAIAVDPVNSNHIFIGTAVARHGSSSVNGGRFTPPGAPTIGLYESTDGGATFLLVFSRASDTVAVGTPTGNDFFRGGVSKILFDRTGLSGSDASRVYFSVFDYGIFRSNGAGGYEQIFASAGGGTVANSLASRTEFALAPNAAALRIYAGDVGGGAADFYRVDNALVAAATLTNGVANPGWTKLSSPTKGTPGFSSYNFCTGQCSYDMVVASPPGHPDTVWLSGSMQYSEIFTAHPPSNGRAVQRSIDAGVHFTDMTNDTQSPPLGMHPDHHAAVFAASNPDIAFLGSDGGVVRTSGSFADASADCANRGLAAVDLVDCQMWLAAIPTLISSMNNKLATLQFQSLSVNPSNPLNDLLGGTQDNGTWAFNAKGTGSWFESVGGDGGQSGTDVANSSIRMHTYFSAQGDVNFHGTDPLGWDWFADVLLGSGEASSFYIPLINDPNVSGTWFVGMQHVWRTLDNAGPQAFLDSNCNEFFGTFTLPCGDWVPLGGPTLTGTAFGADKTGSYVVANERAPSNNSTLWAATRIGRLFISQNANNPANTNVTFTRIDTAAQPQRFISGISIHPTDPNHAWVSFSGYNAYTPTTPGHVFEVVFDPNANTATWTDLSNNLGDQPITDIARDDTTGDLFVSTDFGVAMLPNGTTTWVPAAGSFPPVATYGLTINSAARVLYAATHGRGAWKLDLSK